MQSNDSSFRPLGTSGKNEIQAKTRYPWWWGPGGVWLDTSQVTKSHSTISCPLTACVLGDRGAATPGIQENEVMWVFAPGVAMETPHYL